MSATHSYEVNVRWTGNLGSGTSGYKAYGRHHEVGSGTKPPILGSSDPAFRGDAECWNPEELFLASVSQCHMLWYLHLASVGGIVVLDYTDSSRGLMAENDDGSGQFVSMTLRPAVTVVDQSMLEGAISLHDEVGRNCFIARSVAFPIYHDSSTFIAGGTNGATHHAREGRDAGGPM